MKFKYKRIVFVLVILFIALLSAAYFILQSKPTEVNLKGSSTNSTNNKTITDHKAAFAIYTNNTFRIFSDPMYHNLSSDVFIQESNPNIINVKNSSITWRDFFLTLPFSIDEECLITGTKQTFCNNEQYSLQFFINGVRDKSALDKKINPGDKLLVTYDRENSDNIFNQLQSVSDTN